MENGTIVHKVSRNWRLLLVGAVVGAVVFAGYSLLSRSAGDYSRSIAFRLADPKAAVVSARLDDRLGAFETATGVADLLQSTAENKFDLPDGVRVTARGIDGSRSVVLTVTGVQDAVDDSIGILTSAVPEDRAADVRRTLKQASESTTEALAALSAKLALVDGEIDNLADGSDVLRERLLLERVETSGQILEVEQQIAGLRRLSESAPEAFTTVSVVTPGQSVGTGLPTAAVLGLMFGALVALVVVLTRPVHPRPTDAGIAAP